MTVGLAWRRRQGGWLSDAVEAQLQASRRVAPLTLRQRMIASASPKPSTAIWIAVTTGASIFFSWLLILWNPSFLVESVGHNGLDGGPGRGPTGSALAGAQQRDHGDHHEEAGGQRMVTHRGRAYRLRARPAGVRGTAASRPHRTKQASTDNWIRKGQTSVDYRLWGRHLCVAGA